jgi:hypothetical protein
MEIIGTAPHWNGDPDPMKAASGVQLDWTLAWKKVDAKVSW